MRKALFEDDGGRGRRCRDADAELCVDLGRDRPRSKRGLQRATGRSRSWAGTSGSTACADDNNTLVKDRIRNSVDRDVDREGHATSDEQPRSSTSRYLAGARTRTRDRNHGSVHRRASVPTSASAAGGARCTATGGRARTTRARWSSTSSTRPAGSWSGAPTRETEINKPISDQKMQKVIDKAFKSFPPQSPSTIDVEVDARSGGREAMVAGLEPPARAAHRSDAGQARRPSCPTATTGCSSRSGTAFARWSSATATRSTCRAAIAARSRAISPSCWRRSARACRRARCSTARS